MPKRKRTVEFIEDDVKRFRPLHNKNKKQSLKKMDKQEALIERQQVLMEKMFKRVKQLEERIVQLEEMMELESYEGVRHIYF